MRKQTKNKKESFKVDILVLFLMLGVAMIYAYLTRDLFIGKSLFGGIVFTIPPVIYLGLRKKKNWKKLLIAALTFGVLYGFALSFYAEATKSWSTIPSIFNFRLFGLNTLEEIFGHGLMAMTIFTFYEHFFDTENDKKINRRYIWAILIGIFGSIALVIIKLLTPGKFSTFEYPYVVIGTIAIIPLILAVIKKPTFLPKLALTSLYFFIFWFLIEFQAVGYNYWIYPGNYIGWVDFLNVKYPFEELFYWMLLYAPTIIIYYEFFMDDGK